MEYRIFLFGLIILSCGLKADGLNNLKLHWDAPTHYSNGEKLNAGRALKEYRLYYGATKEAVRTEYISIAPQKKFILLKKLDFSRIKSPIIYFAMTAISKSGNESDLSEVIFYLP